MPIRCWPTKRVETYTVAKNVEQICIHSVRHIKWNILGQGITKTIRETVDREVLNKLLTIPATYLQTPPVLTRQQGKQNQKLKIKIITKNTKSRLGVFGDAHSRNARISPQKRLQNSGEHATSTSKPHVYKKHIWHAILQKSEKTRKGLSEVNLGTRNHTLAAGKRMKFYTTGTAAPGGNFKQRARNAANGCRALHR